MSRTDANLTLLSTFLSPLASFPYSPVCMCMYACVCVPTACRLLAGVQGNLEDAPLHIIPRSIATQGGWAEIEREEGGGMRG